MKWMIGTLVLLTAITMVAQQTPQSTGFSPAAPAVSNGEVRHEIDSTLTTAPEMSNAVVEVTVNDTAVSLDGYVGSQQEHDYALQVAAADAGGRQIVDDLQIGGFNQ